jgi:hypothetical protein
MSADQDLKQELEAVKQELWKLRGQTVYTYPECQPNKILKIDDDGFQVERTKLTVIPWRSVLNQYVELRKSKKLSNKDQGWNRSNGSFKRAVLLVLSTVKPVSPKPPTIRYEIGGKPVHLRPRQEWPCPKSSL